MLPATMSVQDDIQNKEVEPNQPEPKPKAVTKAKSLKSFKSLSSVDALKADFEKKMLT
jgi:hypothetical protein